MMLEQIAFGYGSPTVFGCGIKTFDSIEFMF